MIIGSIIKRRLPITTSRSATDALSSSSSSFCWKTFPGQLVFGCRSRRRRQGPLPPIASPHVQLCHYYFSNKYCNTHCQQRTFTTTKNEEDEESKVIPIPKYDGISKNKLISIVKNDNDDDNIANDTDAADVDDILNRIPLEDVRNFCFIAHVDHGKSSLSSRLLEITGNMGPTGQINALQIATAATTPKQETSSSESESSSSSYGVEKENNATTTSTTTKKSAEGKEQIQLLDTLSVERERGITVKATTASMLYPHPSAVGPDGILLLNMIDTPGHADFGREVSRSLSFVQGAVLLLDATQGIQAQTWTVYEKARSMSIQPELILAMTKIDLDAARPIHVALTVSEWLNIDDPDDIIPTSARNRIGIAELLHAICQRVPSPKPLPDDDHDNHDDDGDDKNNVTTKRKKNKGKSILRAQVVDSWYDSRGVNCLVQILSGTLSEGDRIGIPDITSQQSTSTSSTSSSSTSSTSYPVQEVGLVVPKSIRTGKLRRGQMGYVRFGLRDPRQANPGTFLIDYNFIGSVNELYFPTNDKNDGNDGGSTDNDAAKSVLYASVHPEEEDGFEDLCEAVDRLALNDKGLEVSRTADRGAASSERGGPFLGPGLRVGFQGLLHVEVFRQRLLDEFGLEAVVTPPKVPYCVTFLPSKSNNLSEPYTEIIEDLSSWPTYGTKFTVKEPMVEARIMAPAEYTGAVMDLITRKRGTDLRSKPIDEDTWVFEARMPWAEVVVNFHDMLKTTTAGYGSMDTFEANPPMEESKLSKVDILLNGDIVEPLSFVSYTPNAQMEARSVCKKLQEVLPRQQFVVVIQAKADGKVIASEKIRAYRKDVLTKSGKMVGGGDITRKKKLLEKQKQGKKRQQQSGKVSLSQSAFNSVISRSSS